MLDGPTQELPNTNESPPPEIRGKDILGLIQRTKDKIETDPPETNKVGSEWLPNITRLEDAQKILEGLTDPELNKITLSEFIEASDTYHLTEEDFFYIKLQHQTEQAQKHEFESIIDVLTELPNRRKFFSELERSVQSVLITHITKLLHVKDQRTDPSTGIVVAEIDLDHFKTLNDGLGKSHVYGDKKLKEFARLLEQTYRRPINIGRIGGEEFGISIEISTSNENNIDNILKSLDERRSLISNKIKESVTYKDENYTAGTLSMGIVYFPGLELVHELKTQVNESNFSKQEKQLLTNILEGEYSDLQDNERLQYLESCIELLSTETGQAVVSLLTNSVVYTYTDDQEKIAKLSRDRSVMSIYKSVDQPNTEPTTPPPTPASPPGPTTH